MVRIEDVEMACIMDAFHENYPPQNVIHACIAQAFGAQKLNTERMSVIAGPPCCSREAQASGNHRRILTLEFCDWLRSSLILCAFVNTPHGFEIPFY